MKKAQEWRNDGGEKKGKWGESRVGGWMSGGMGGWMHESQDHTSQPRVSYKISCTRLPPGEKRWNTNYLSLSWLFLTATVFSQVKLSFEHVDFVMWKIDQLIKVPASKQDQNWPVSVCNNVAILFMFLRKCLAMSLGCVVLPGVLWNVPHCELF